MESLGLNSAELRDGALLSYGLVSRGGILEVSMRTGDKGKGSPLGLPGEPRNPSYKVRPIGCIWDGDPKAYRAVGGGV